MCGEHACASNQAYDDPGSSPRVRGTLRGARRVEGAEGIIPACAGNTSTPRALSLGSRDHPRVCGEHATSAVTVRPWPGSSPRVRGTLQFDYHPRVRLGIIPACAGNTRVTGRRRGWTGDHPRVCGEHLWYLESLAIGAGSSPRVRGTHQDAVRHQVIAGIIPACAGNTRHCRY